MHLKTNLTSTNEPFPFPVDPFQTSETGKPRSATTPTALLNHQMPSLQTNASKVVASNLPQVTVTNSDEIVVCDVCIQHAKLQLQIDQPKSDCKKNKKSGKRRKQEEISPADPSELLRPSDGGFGWMVVIASFLCSVIVDGIIFSFGVLLLEISRDLGQSKGTTAWVGSLQTGFYLIVGPFVSFLANKYGCRIVTVAGSVISFIGFALSFYAKDVFTLCLTFGVLGGIGYGFIYLPAIVMVASYFEEKRAFATGIAVCGSGIGGFVMAPFTQFLLDKLGWRGCMFALACVNLICLVSALFFKPIQQYNRARLERERKAQYEQLMVEEPLLGDGEESGDEEEEFDIIFARRCAYHQKTSSPFLPKNPFSVHNQPKNCPKTSSFVINHQEGRNRAFSNQTEKIVSPVDSTAKKVRCNSYLSASTISFAAAGVAVVTCSQDRLRTFSLNIQTAGSVLGGGTESMSTDPKKLNQLTTDNDDQNDGNQSINSSIFDMSLLLSPSFLLFACSGFLTLSGFFIPFVYLVDLAVNQGASAETAALLLSVIGITNTLGRVFCGWISDWPKIDALVINNVALIVGGLFTALSPILCNSYLMLVVYSIVFGFSIACFAALRSVITIDLLGLDKLTSAFGLLLLPQGIATIIGAPVAGWFYDITGTYDASFYAAGIVILVSGVICIPLPAISKWEKKRSAKKLKSIEQEPKP